MILGPVHYRVDSWFDTDWHVLGRTPDRAQAVKLYERVGKKMRCRLVEVREFVIVEVTP